MGESGAASDTGLVAVVRGVLEELGVTDAPVIAEATRLCRNHPRWAVWLPGSGGGWAAVRPAGSRPPGPEVPMLWVRAESAGELAASMSAADTTLSPPDYGR